MILEINALGAPKARERSVTLKENRPIASERRKLAAAAQGHSDGSSPELRMTGGGTIKNKESSSYASTLLVTQFGNQSSGGALINEIHALHEHNAVEESDEILA